MKQDQEDIQPLIVHHRNKSAYQIMAIFNKL